MIQEILALCRAMGAAEDQFDLLVPLVRAVAAQLAGQLKQGLTPEDCAGVFPTAAALSAMDQLARITGDTSDISSFTAGDLTIHRSSSGKSLAAQAKALLAPWLRDNTFCFQEVDG